MPQVAQERGRTLVECALRCFGRFLVASDGVTDMVASEVISSTLWTANDPLRAARRLAAKAFRRGARDNVSLLVARCLDAPDL
jgi:serine/threonine protein phosphatase PrpC